MRQPASTVTSVFAGMATSRTSACGLAPFSAAATIESNESSEEPCSWKSSRTRQASSISVLPVNCSSARAAKTRSEIAAAARMLSSSAGSLTARSRSTIPVRETVSTPPSRSASWLATVRMCASIATVWPASRVARSPITARAVCSKRTPSSALAFCA